MSGDIADIPTKTGAYYIGADVTGKPFEGECLGFVVSDGYTQQLYLYEGSIEHRRYGSGSIWNDWEVTATATPPQTGSLQFESGFYAVYPIAWTRNQFGEIHVGGVVAYDGLQNMIANDVVVATLPVGYRPSATIEMPATFQNITDGTRFAGTVSINPSGEIMFYLVGAATYAIFDADFSV